MFSQAIYVAADPGNRYEASQENHQEPQLVY